MLFSVLNDVSQLPTVRIKSKDNFLIKYHRKVSKWTELSAETKIKHLIGNYSHTKVIKLALREKSEYLWQQAKTLQIRVFYD